MRYFFSLIIVSLLIVSCNNNFNRKDANAIVKVGNETLYRSVLEDNIPEGLSPEDSTIAAEHFIRLWINENLLYNIALKNFNDKDNIKQLVDNYRKSLFINQYEEQLINEKLTNEIDEQSLQDYYSQNKDKLKLDHALMKGLFLKVPVNAPQLNEIRIWYKSTSSVSRENLQKLSLNNATVFNYFTDQWMNFDDIMNNFPNEQLTKEDLTVRKKTVEKQDDNFFYFLNVTDCMLPGDNAPYEYAKHTIQEILLNQRKIDFLKKTEDDLYQRAIDKGDIQFFNE